MFLPDDPRLRTHAFSIAEARRHVLRPASTADDEATDLQRDSMPDAIDEVGTAEQLSLFSVLSSVATGMQMHSVTSEGVAYDDEPEITLGEYDEATLEALNLDLPDVPTDAGFARDDTRSVAEIKDDLRARNALVAQRLVDLTGMGHGKVNAEMNRLAGVAKVSSATTDQLERRLRYAESWLRRVRGR